MQTPPDYVPPPPPGPERVHLFGNRLRWAAHMVRYSRYRRQLRRYEEAGA